MLACSNGCKTSLLTLFLLLLLRKTVHKVHLKSFRQYRQHQSLHMLQITASLSGREVIVRNKHKTTLKHEQLKHTHNMTVA